ncbi:MAG: helix-turn-helix domain-containing protein, partial [Acholeplasmatales bacterium]|nr:helix-turn-helix domain-containing protein [Acholeplasmatales bacterium]
MKILLNENISKYRKENKMTQEDLAEALGVTFAAVSKWERGLATPDIELIIQMANIFDISVDALIGYQLKSSNIEELIKKAEMLIIENKNEDAIIECNNALAKYPNNFKVVYLSAKIYQIIG